MKELVEKARQELRTNAYVRYNLKIEVTGVNGSENFILLKGAGKSFFQKQMAQEVVLRIIRSSGKEKDISLRNEIDVDYSPK